MRALRWHGRRDVRLDQVPLPGRPGEGDIVVRVSYCGLCGSDLHEYLEGPSQIPLGKPHPLTGMAAPITMGHEISGRIDTVGSDVEDLSVGDLVALNALLPCGTCRRCLAGDPQVCEVLGHLGFSANGGLADLVVVPAAMAVRAPTGLSPRCTALAEPFAVAMRMWRRAGHHYPGSVLTIGAGSIGLAVAVVAFAYGRQVVIVDPDFRRRAHAKAMGFDSYPDATSVGRQFDLVFECSGTISGFADGQAALARAGSMICGGIPVSPGSIDVAALVLGEQSIVGSVGHTVSGDLIPALEILNRHSDLAQQLITATIPLDRAVVDGFSSLSGPDKGTHAKILVEVNQ